MDQDYEKEKKTERKNVDRCQEISIGEYIAKCKGMHSYVACMPLLLSRQSEYLCICPRSKNSLAAFQCPTPIYSFEYLFSLSG